MSLSTVLTTSLLHHCHESMRRWDFLRIVRYWSTRGHSSSEQRAAFLFSAPAASAPLCVFVTDQMRWIISSVCVVLLFVFGFFQQPIVNLFCESLSFSKKLANFFYFYTNLLKYLSLLIIQNHIFLLILALLRRAYSVDLQKLERSVLFVRNSQWNLRNRPQTRYVACQQF